MYALAIIGVLLLVPALIVWFWKSKPAAALIVALLFFLIATAAAMFFLNLHAMALGGSFSEPRPLEVTPRVISYTVMSTVGVMTAGIPLLICIQWISRRLSRSAKG